MPTFTDEFEFKLPIDGGDDDTWGEALNDNWSKLDLILAAIDQKIIATRIPVGGLYLSTDDNTPGATLGYGTWARYAAGRALVGVGPGTGAFWNAGEERGAATHTLTDAEMPEHRHSVPGQTVETREAGEHTHSFNYIYYDDPPNNNQIGKGLRYARLTNTAVTDPAGEHVHDVDIPQQLTNFQGGNDAHNNIQPSIGIYVFVRTA